MFDLLFLRYIYLFQSHFLYYINFLKKNLIFDNDNFLKKDYKNLNLFFYNFYIYKHIININKLNKFFTYYKLEKILDINTLNLNNFIFLKNKNIKLLITNPLDLKINNINLLEDFKNNLKIKNKKKYIFYNFIFKNYIKKNNNNHIFYIYNLKLNIINYKNLSVKLYFNINLIKFIYININKYYLKFKNKFKFKIFKFVFMYFFKELFYFFGIQILFKTKSILDFNILLNKNKEINIYILKFFKENKIIFFNFLILGIEQILNLNELKIEIDNIKIIFILLLENINIIFNKFIYFLFYDFFNFIEYNIFENLEFIYKTFNILFNTYNINCFKICEYNNYIKILNLKNFNNINFFKYSLYFFLYFFLLIQYNNLYNIKFKKNIEFKNRMDIIKNNKDIYLIYENIDFLINLNFESFDIEENKILDMIFLNKFYKIINILKKNVFLMDKLIKKNNLILFKNIWGISLNEIIDEPKLLINLQLENINKKYNETPLYFFIYIISL